MRNTTWLGNLQGNKILDKTKLEAFAGNKWALNKIYDDFYCW